MNARFALVCPLLLTLGSSACVQPGCDPDLDCVADDGETSETQETGTTETETDTGETETDTGETETDTDEPGLCEVDNPIVVLETNMGTMVVQLDGVRAPITVANFTTYVAMGFYDGTIFHRVIRNFVVQGGGFEPGLVPKTTLGPIPLELHPELTHVDGAIAMARSMEPDTAESQFYITDGAQPGLDGNYAVFGVLIDGFDVRDAIADVAVQDVPWMGIELGDVPIEDVMLESAYCAETWP